MWRGLAKGPRISKYGWWTWTGELDPINVPHSSTIRCQVGWSDGYIHSLLTRADLLSIVTFPPFLNLSSPSIDPSRDMFDPEMPTRKTMDSFWI